MEQNRLLTRNKLRPVNLGNSVVLLSNMNRSTCGTGFVVGRRGDTAYVYTCDHVLDDLGGSEQIWIANRQARVEFSGKSHGIDLAVLAVKGFASAQPLQFTGTVPKPRTPFSLWGYSQLHSNSDKYIGQLVTGKFGASIAMQAQTSDCAVLAWELTINNKSRPLLGGYSGAPILINGGTVVAVASHKFDDRRGLAISVHALQPPEAKQPLWALERTTAIETDMAAELPALPVEGPNPEDPQKDRWGGSPERSGVKLSAIVTDVRKEYFYFDLVVRSTDGSPLGGPSRFHLHPSYPRSVITIRKVRPNNTLVLEGVSADGIYTIGAEVMRPDRSVVRLELDLGDLPGLPKRFR